MSLRTPEAHDSYHAIVKAGWTGCPLCEAEPIKQYKYWKIIDNKYPYNKIAFKHHMIVPLRHITEKDVTQDEWMELSQLKHTELADNYDTWLERFHGTIPEHLHVHLIVSGEGLA